MGVVLSGAMVLVLLLSLTHIDESAPADVRLAVSARADRSARLAETTDSRASRSRGLSARQSIGAIEASMAVPTTTTSTTAVKPTPTTARRVLAKPKPTTTTARVVAAAAPKPRPTTTTTAAVAEASNVVEGRASWYEGPAGVCAHRTLPFGTTLNVTNLSNGKSTRCTVNERGPFTGGRVLDLSRDSFAQLAGLEAGVISVRVEW